MIASVPVPEFCTVPLFTNRAIAALRVVAVELVSRSAVVTRLIVILPAPESRIVPPLSLLRLLLETVALPGGVNPP